MAENVRKVIGFTIISFARHLIQYIDEEDDDDEGYEIIMIGTQVREQPNRIVGYLENVVANYTAVEFQQHFRLSSEAFEYLLGQVGPLLFTHQDRQQGRPNIDPRKQLLAVIWILATPDSYRSVGEKFDMAKSSLSLCFVRVINALCIIAPNIIRWLQGAGIDRTKEKFQRLSNIPNVIGAVDGSYIPIKAPKQDAEVYINRKCFYAITLQEICNASLKFIDCYAGYPSSVSDVRIFRNSDIYRNIIVNTNRYFPGDEFLLGDKAYPVLQWLIPPYIDRGSLNTVHRQFNETLSKSRQVIERAFALFKGRFRRLKYLDMNPTDLIPSTILAACVIHNICIDHRDQCLDQYIHEGIDNEADMNENFGNVVQVGHQEINGNEKRNNLANDLFRRR